MKQFTILISLLVLSCNNPSKPVAENKPKAKHPGAYFDFDEITHYRSDIQEGQISGLFEEKSRILDLILQDSPDSLSDTAFINDLDQLPFIKTRIDSKHHYEISAIFSDRMRDDSLEAACIAIYRDILIFRKNKQICGLAKVCFSCEKKYILGTKLNTRGFGKHGDFDKLKAILDHNLKTSRGLTIPSKD
jgi:hypothetical protein